MGTVDSQPTVESIRLLHVDDEPEFADLTATFLEREDDAFDVRIATSVSEAMDRLAADSFDCVVSDYDMQGRNGIEFLEAVREEYPNLPFVLYTGKGSEEVASDAISAGVTDYLQKEAGTGQYAVLANRVRNAVERYRTQTELADSRERLDLFVAQSPLGVIEWNERFEVVRLNDAAESILGYDEAELTGRSWEAIVPDSDRADVGAVVDELLENDGGLHSVNTNVRKDGERIVCEWHNRVVTDDDGDTVAIFSQFQDVTERRQHRRRFEAIFNNTHTLAGLMEPDGTLLEANETALSFGDLDREDVVGERLWNTAWIGDEETRATVEAAVERARNGEPFRNEIRIQGADREAIIDFSIRPITDDRGEVTLLVPEGRDISDRKRQERKRQEIIDRVTDAIVEVDDDWRFTLVNDQAVELYGMDESYLLGRNFWDVFEEAQGTRFEETYRRAMTEREHASITEYYEGLDGWFDIEVYPNDDGGLAFYFVDVTDQRERQRELERRSERFQYVEAVADIGYWEIDTQTPEPHDVTLTDGVYRIHGLSPDEPFDVESGFEFYHSEDRPTVERDVERAIADGEPYEHEARIVTADGDERWIHSVGDPVEHDGEVVAVHGVFQDITDRKRHEQALARKNERLDEFASIVSHDLRNPLDVADGRIDLARRDRESDHLDDAADAIQRCQSLIDDLLALARDAGEPESLDSIDLARQAERCWENVPTEDARLRVETERTIRADERRLRQVLENLFRNAVEHSSTGNRPRPDDAVEHGSTGNQQQTGDAVDHSSTGNRPRPDDADELTVRVGDLGDGFYVADDGTGLPAGERGRLFEAGYSTADDRAGFGLAIVERIVDAHGWDVDVTDADGGGARFEITGVDVE
jgi:PAS domain S-box-containing protein